MKKFPILLVAILLTGCSPLKESSSESKPSESSVITRTFDDDEVIYFKTYYYEGSIVEGFLSITAGGEVHTDFGCLENRPDWLSDFLSSMSEKPPIYTLSESESELFRSYIGSINTESEWIKDEHMEYPDVEIISTGEFCYIDGKQTTINSRWHYDSYLDDENAIAAVKFVNNLDFINEWELEVDAKLFDRYYNE